MTISNAEDLALPRGYLFTDSVDADGAVCRRAIRFDVAASIMIYAKPATPEDLFMIEIVVVEGYGIAATTQLAEIQWFLQTYGSAEISAWAMGHVPEFGEDAQVEVFESSPAREAVMVMVAANSPNAIAFMIGLLPPNVLAP
jgi:hypothetical protein